MGTPPILCGRKSVFSGLEVEGSEVIDSKT